MALKAKQPEEVEISKPKFLISGDSGVGKTFFALDFPKPYLIDVEKGATRPQYKKRLKEVGGVYFGQEEGSQDFTTVIAEVKELATTKHPYKTLIIDSFSYLYMIEAAIAEQIVGSDFGKDKKEAQKPTKQLMRWLDKIDMNVIIICHSRIKWVKKGKELVSEGSTFDGWDKMEYILDLWIEILKGGKTFMIRKSRIESLPQDTSMPLSYKAFADVYGNGVIERASKPATLATLEQIKGISGLIEALNIDQDQIDKWFKKVDVDAWDEMTSVQIMGLTDVLNKKVAGLTRGGEMIDLIHEILNDHLVVMRLSPTDDFTSKVIR